eukprot:694829-Rhodomonas_salina.3
MAKMTRWRGIIVMILELMGGSGVRERNESHETSQAIPCETSPPAHATDQAQPARVHRALGGARRSCIGPRVY